MNFYDLDNGGSLSYNEFMKFILPCDDPQLRADATQRKTYKADIKNGARLHPNVEAAIVEFLEREIQVHTKIELMKKVLQSCPDWNVKAAFNLIDSQGQGYVSHPQIYAFLFQNGINATDEELIAIIRRIDASGNGQLEFDEFREVCEPIIIKMNNIKQVEDQGRLIAGHRSIEGEYSQPFVKKTGPKDIDQPLHLGNSLEENLKLYDNYQRMQEHDLMQTPGKRGNSPLRSNPTQHELYSAKAAAKGSTPYPRGPPMTDMTNVHSGSIPITGSQKLNCSPLHPQDEQELTQLLFDMITNETELERVKQQCVEMGDFNLMDAFAMIDEKSLGWVSAPQILTWLIEHEQFVHKDDVYNFTRRFDRDMDSRLLYSDFCEAVTPKDTYYAHAL